MHPDCRKYRQNTNFWPWEEENTDDSKDRAPKKEGQNQRILYIELD